MQTKNVYSSWVVSCWCIGGRKGWLSNAGSRYFVKVKTLCFGHQYKNIALHVQEVIVHYVLLIWCGLLWVVLTKIFNNCYSDWYLTQPSSSSRLKSTAIVTAQTCLTVVTRTAGRNRLFWSGALAQIIGVVCATFDRLPRWLSSSSFTSSWPVCVSAKTGAKKLIKKPKTATLVDMARACPPIWFQYYTFFDVMSTFDDAFRLLTIFLIDV